MMIKNIDRQTVLFLSSNLIVKIEEYIEIVIYSY